MQPERPSRRKPKPMDPIAPEQFGRDQAWHLLWRAGFGATPRQIADLTALGPEAAVDYLLSPERVAVDEIASDRFDRDIMRPPTEDERRAAQMARRAQDEEVLAQARLRRQQAERKDRQQMRDITRWWLERLIETPRPLEEKMVLFWHGHFATSYRTIENSYHMFLQNQFFRRHALGRFSDLLHGIVRDPAMIAYLDNNDSRKDRPNENLARELMELFALGVGNYSERDIKEGARALTGYTFDDDEFRFVERNHDPNPKTILGQSARHDGESFVDAILATNACATFIAAKLYRFFVADCPADLREAPDEARAAIEATARTLRASGYDIKPALRQLFLSRQFYSDAVVGQHIKSPAELVVGAVRSLLTPARDLGALAEAMDLMGQSLFYPPSVKGWDGGRSWINTSTLYVRQNILVYLITGRKPAGLDALASKETYDASGLAEAVAGPHADEGELATKLSSFMFGRASDRLALPLRDAMIQAGGRHEPNAVTAALLLATATPEYQLC